MNWNKGAYFVQQAAGQFCDAAIGQQTKETAYGKET
ncbi:hypothetical protein SAMN05216406_10199 [Nitrosomonas ureae]|uniref:Uncharacterized protein n=1 Tax=Nitrosomonas ureae TaxID=44577 RepID=A0A1H2DM87_9PROT|nr:hypothetical protein SAMN05216406_10199 [Nitrosomonas ureae]